jgi:hypothetical protein
MPLELNQLGLPRDLGKALRMNVIMDAWSRLMSQSFRFRQGRGD